MEFFLLDVIISFYGPSKNMIFIRLFSVINKMHPIFVYSIISLIFPHGNQLSKGIILVLCQTAFIHRYKYMYISHTCNILIRSFFLCDSCVQVVVANVIIYFYGTNFLLFFLFVLPFTLSSFCILVAYTISYSIMFLEYIRLYFSFLFSFIFIFFSLHYRYLHFHRKIFQLRFLVILLCTNGNNFYHRYFMRKRMKMAIRIYFHGIEVELVEKKSAREE